MAEQFAKLSDKPLRALIYTHNHTDHVTRGSTVDLARFLAYFKPPE